MEMRNENCSMLMTLFASMVGKCGFMTQGRGTLNVEVIVMLVGNFFGKP